MTQEENINLEEETISKVGLQLVDEPLQAEVPIGSRVFEYPELDKVFIMEKDLYGNIIPRDSCYLAFYGQHGLIGKLLKIETLKNSSISDIRKIVDNNVEA